jgi:hypothetical protein
MQEYPLIIERLPKANSLSNKERTESHTDIQEYPSANRAPSESQVLLGGKERAESPTGMQYPSYRQSSTPESQKMVGQLTYNWLHRNTVRKSIVMRNTAQDRASCRVG